MEENLKYSDSDEDLHPEGLFSKTIRSRYPGPPQDRTCLGMVTTNEIPEEENYILEANLRVALSFAITALKQSSMKNSALRQGLESNLKGLQECKGLIIKKS